MKGEGDVLPIGLKLSGRACLVVGRGAEAWPRTRALLATGANVRIVSSEPPRELVEGSSHERATLEAREFVESDLDDVWLAVLTDPDPALAERMARAAEARHVFLCAVDQPAHSTYSHLALSRRGPLVVAVSTSGRAPALARRLREELDRVLASADVEAFIDELAALRERTPSADRRAVLAEAVAGVHLDGNLVLPPSA